jgi:hypothetical protein
MTDRDKRLPESADELVRDIRRARNRSTLSWVVEYAVFYPIQCIEFFKNGGTEWCSSVSGIANARSLILPSVTDSTPLRGPRKVIDLHARAEFAWFDLLAVCNRKAYILEAGRPMLANRCSRELVVLGG